MDDDDTNSQTQGKQRQKHSLEIVAFGKSWKTPSFEV
jgi:hypothetical protein